MAIALPRLPEAQLAPLRRAYDEAAAAKRRRAVLGFMGLCLAILISGWMAEIRPGTLVANIAGFFSYFGRLAYFDSGKLAGQPVWTDVGEWYWGLGHWLSL